jgi:hypothetical protein
MLFLVSHSAPIIICFYFHFLKLLTNKIREGCTQRSVMILTSFLNSPKIAVIIGATTLRLMTLRIKTLSIAKKLL